MFRRIKNRLIVALLSVAAVPLVVIGFYSIHSNTAALQELARASARERVHLKAEKIEDMLRDIRDDLAFLARSPMLIGLLDGTAGNGEGEGFWIQKLGQQFLAFAQNKSIYARVWYLDETGQGVVQAEFDGLRAWLVPADKLVTHRDQAYFQAAMLLSGKEVSVSANNRLGTDGYDSVVRYALRVADRQDRRRGILIVDVWTQKIVAVVRQVGDADHVKTALLLNSGKSIAGKEAIFSDVAEVLGRFRAGETAVLQERDSVTVSWAPVLPALPRTDPVWVLQDIVPNESVFASVWRFQVLFFSLVVVTLLVGGGLSLLLARRMAEPLGELSRGAQRIAGGDLSHRLMVNSGDEIQAVAEEFNRMGQALQETYRQLQVRDQEKTIRLEQVTQQLLEQEKLAAVGRLAAGVAHEVNNPVGIVSMFVQQLLERDDLPAICREKLQIIERHTERIGRVTRGLLDFARGGDIRREVVDLVGALQETVEALTPRFHEAHIQIEVKGSPPPDGVGVMGNGAQLQQVFENLMINAIQAMIREGTLTIAMAYTVDTVQVVFADTGPGIQEENMGQVFEPFFTTKEVGQGTGLGLAISFGIVKAHGGHMIVNNAPEGGAVFTVVLPLENMDQTSLMASG